MLPPSSQRERHIRLPATDRLRDQAATISIQRTLRARNDAPLIIAQLDFAELRGRQRVEPDVRNGGERRLQSVVGV
jgi:hypothetical protein